MSSDGGNGIPGFGFAFRASVQEFTRCRALFLAGGYLSRTVVRFLLALSTTKPSTNYPEPASGVHEERKFIPGKVIVLFITPRFRHGEDNIALSAKNIRNRMKISFSREFRISWNFRFFCSSKFVDLANKLELRNWCTIDTEKIIPYGCTIPRSLSIWLISSN